MYGKRLKEALKMLGMSLKDFSVAMNIPYSTAQNISAGSQKISPELAVEAEELLKISAVYLLLGKGPVLMDGYNTMMQVYGGSKIADSDRIQIPFYSDIFASAGNGYSNPDYSPLELITLPKSLIPSLVNHQDIEAIRVFGDSMSPTIKENDIAFVYRPKAFIESIDNGKIYIVQKGEDDELYIKRLFKTKNNQVIVRSDNSLYPEEVYERTELKLIAKFLLNITEV